MTSMGTIEKLCKAAWDGNLNEVRNVLGRATKSETNGCNIRGQCALYCASRQGHIDIVIELLNFDGIDVDVAASPHGGTPLHGAGAGHHAAVVALLLVRNADSNKTNAMGLSARQEAKGDAIIDVYSFFDGKPALSNVLAKFPQASNLKPAKEKSGKGFGSLIKQESKKALQRASMGGNTAVSADQTKQIRSPNGPSSPNPNHLNRMSAPAGGPRGGNVISPNKPPAQNQVARGTAAPNTTQSQQLPNRGGNPLGVGAGNMGARAPGPPQTAGLGAPVSLSGVPTQPRGGIAGLPQPQTSLAQPARGPGGLPTPASRGPVPGGPGAPGIGIAGLPGPANRGPVPGVANRGPVPGPSLTTSGGIPASAGLAPAGPGMSGIRGIGSPVATPGVGSPMGTPPGVGMAQTPRGAVPPGLAPAGPGMRGQGMGPGNPASLAGSGGPAVSTPPGHGIAPAGPGIGAPGMRGQGMGPGNPGGPMGGLPPGPAGARGQGMGGPRGGPGGMVPTGPGMAGPGMAGPGMRGQGMGGAPGSPGGPRGGGGVQGLGQRASGDPIQQRSSGDPFQQRSSGDPLQRGGPAPAGTVQRGGAVPTPAPVDIAPEPAPVSTPAPAPEPAATPVASSDPPAAETAVERLARLRAAREAKQQETDLLNAEKTKKAEIDAQIAGLMPEHEQLKKKLQVQQEGVDAITKKIQETETSTQTSRQKLTDATQKIKDLEAAVTGHKTRIQQIAQLLANVKAKTIATQAKAEAIRANAARQANLNKLANAEKAVAQAQAGYTSAEQAHAQAKAALAAAIEAEKQASLKLQTAKTDLDAKQQTLQTIKSDPALAQAAVAIPEVVDIPMTPIVAEEPAAAQQNHVADPSQQYNEFGEQNYNEQGYNHEGEQPFNTEYDNEYPQHGYENFSEQGYEDYSNEQVYTENGEANYEQQQAGFGEAEYAQYGIEGGYQYEGQGGEYQYGGEQEYDHFGYEENEYYGEEGEYYQQ